ncbi:MobA/MobL protein [Bradyrhizobiaceae bacterium SG-6C]|nr:MobA/MobL protein [Bradyrhizobiaceae bacterium SG-6C]
MLAQHAVYVSRLSASDHCIAINFSQNTHKFRREVAEYEQSVTRKNARLIDKIVINLDARMDSEARDEAVRSFLISLTKGQSRARADFHLGDGHNPHVHIVYVDKSVHDGKKVQHLSDSPRDRAKRGLEPNGTDWLRKTWEKDCNAVLEAHGYEFRIDRRSRLERGLEPAKEHVEWRATESPEKPLAQEADDVPTSIEEEAMEREGEHLSHVHVKDALEYDLERQYLHHVQGQAEFHEQARLQAEADHERLSELAREHRKAAKTAEKLADLTAEQLKDYTRPSGKLKGIEIPWVGWKSKKRVRGEELTTEKAIYDQRMIVARTDADAAEYSAQVAEKRAREAMLSAEAHQRELEASVQSFGDKATLETADRVLQNSIETSLSKVSLQEIYADFEIGEITGDEAVRAFELLGEHAMVVAVRERMAIEEEMDPKGAYADGIEM